MTVSHHRRSRPSRAGSVRSFPTLPLHSALRLPVAASPALVLALTATLSGCGADAASSAASSGASSGPVAASPSSTPSSATPSVGGGPEGYGSYPSFLPTDTLGSAFGHQVLDATARRPVLATQGDTVRVHTPAATVLATVTGPAVPVSGQAYQAPTSPATWTVVLRHASAPLRLDPAGFQAIDESGAVHDLQPQGNPPPVVRPGRTVRFTLFSPAFETGEGRLRWIPSGHLAPVEWDFVVETD